MAKKMLCEHYLNIHIAFFIIPIPSVFHPLQYAPICLVVEVI